MCALTVTYFARFRKVLPAQARDACLNSFFEERFADAVAACFLFTSKLRPDTVS